jgi:hypothetical protein
MTAQSQPGAAAIVTGLAVAFAVTAALVPIVVGTGLRVTEGALASAVVEPGPNGKLVITVTAGENWLRGPASREQTEALPEVDPEEPPDAVGRAPGGAAPTGEAAVTGHGPQAAFWLEDPMGNFVTTIYVTRRAATEDWLGVAGAPEGRAVTPRPLPVWSGKHREIGVEPMASCGACHGKRRSEDKSVEDDPVLEVLSSTASTGSFTREWAVPERVGPGIYGIRAEVNHWMDPNETYANDPVDLDPVHESGPIGSGQPSLVWGGIVEIGPDASEEALVLLGHGHAMGADGELDSDLAGLTTALSIVDSIRVTYLPAD